jgi:hypothetical protein
LRGDGSLVRGASSCRDSRLRWSDVDFKKGVIRVQPSAWRRTIGDGGKGRRSARDVTFGPGIASILESFQNSHASASGLVFENSGSRSLDLWALARREIRPTIEQVWANMEIVLCGTPRSRDRDEPFHKWQLSDHFTPLRPYEGRGGFALCEAVAGRDSQSCPHV